MEKLDILFFFSFLQGLHTVLKGAKNTINKRLICLDMFANTCPLTADVGSRGYSQAGSQCTMGGLASMIQKLFILKFQSIRVNNSNSLQLALEINIVCVYTWLKSWLRGFDSEPLITQNSLYYSIKLANTLLVMT